MGSGWLVEIVVLAMVAGFVALRLVSVLGRRTGHEQPLSQPVDGGRADPQARRAESGESREQPLITSGGNLDPHAVDGVRAIVAVDGDFDVNRFIEGARSAYQMVLEAFWKADREMLKTLVDDSVYQDFSAAIDERTSQGITLDNRLVRIDRATVTDAALHGMTAQVTVRFDADLVAVTKDRDGNVIAGSMSDALQTHDVWTFSRHVKDSDPNWLLVATDEEAA